VTPVQAFNANTLVRIGDVTVDDHGASTANFRFVMSGQDALFWRQEALRVDTDELKKRFDKWLRTITPDGMEAHVDHFLGLDDPSMKLMAVVKADGTLGTVTSKRILLPGFFFESRSAHPFIDEDKRLEPVDMHYGDEITDEVTYHLPATVTVEGSPTPVQIPWPNHAAFGTKTISKPGEVTVARQLARAFTFVKPEEYQDLRGFYQKIAAADQQQLVLIESQTGKGN
jgi:hypothetical protein